MSQYEPGANRSQVDYTYMRHAGMEEAWLRQRYLWQAARDAARVHQKRENSESPHCYTGDIFRIINSKKKDILIALHSTSIHAVPSSIGRADLSEHVASTVCSPMPRCTFLFLGSIPITLLLLSCPVLSDDDATLERHAVAISPEE